MAFLNKSFHETMYGVQKKIFLTFYTVSSICILLIILYLIDSMFSISPKIQLLFGFLMTVAAVIGGSILSVYFDLPKIQTEFDKIKNDIAKKVIRSPEDFGRRLTTLLCDFFNFQFFNIDYSFIKIINTDFIYSDREIIKKENLNLKKISNALEKRSKSTEEIFFYDKCSVNSKTYFLYILPICFGDDWLGFIGILTPQKVWKLFLMFLNNFENESVDDQLMHVLGYKKSQIQKQFYKELDRFSNNITKKQYKQLVEFERDIIDLLIKEIGCKGGLFVTVYDSEIELSLPEHPDKADSVLQQCNAYFSTYDLPPEARILEDPASPFNCIFELPIFIDKLQGIILLFDDSDENFQYFKNTLLEIENIKLDNDLENLAIMLNLQPDEKSPIIKTGQSANRAGE